jgi:hypothetical protein
MLVVLAVAASAASPLHAQLIPRPDSLDRLRCGAEDCALYFVPRWHGVPRISEGLNGPSFSVGLYGGGLLRRVSTNPDALREAKVGSRQRVIGSLGVIASTATFYLAVKRVPGLNFASGSNRRIYIGLAGAIAGVLSVRELGNSDDSFRRAIFVYNGRFQPAP